MHCAPSGLCGRGALMFGFDLSAARSGVLAASVVLSILGDASRSEAQPSEPIRVGLHCSKERVPPDFVAEKFQFPQNRGAPSYLIFGSTDGAELRVYGLKRGCWLQIKSSRKISQFDDAELTGVPPDLSAISSRRKAWRKEERLIGICDRNSDRYISQRNRALMGKIDESIYRPPGGPTEEASFCSILVSHDSAYLPMESGQSRVVIFIVLGEVIWEDLN